MDEKPGGTTPSAKDAKPLDEAQGRGGRGLGPGSKRDAVAIESRRTLVAEMYCKANSQAAIARTLGVNKSTVTRDLKCIRAEWRRQRMEYFDEKVEAMLARIDQLERTYWEAWERSLTDKTTKTAGRVRGTNGTTQIKAESKVEDRLGDPEYLRGVQWCIEQRCKILGVEAAPKAPVDEDGRAVTGVLVLPTAVSAEEWSAVTQAQQAALLKGHGDPNDA